MSWPTLPENCSCTIEGDDHYNTIIRNPDCKFHDEVYRDNERRRSEEYRRILKKRQEALHKFERWVYKASESEVDEILLNLPNVT